MGFQRWSAFYHCCPSSPVVNKVNQCNTLNDTYNLSFFNVWNVHTCLFFICAIPHNSQQCLNPSICPSTGYLVPTFSFSGHGGTGAHIPQSLCKSPGTSWTGQKSTIWECLNQTASISEMQRSPDKGNRNGNIRYSDPSPITGVTFQKPLW